MQLPNNLVDKICNICSSTSYFHNICNQVCLLEEAKRSTIKIQLKYRICVIDNLVWKLINSYSNFLSFYGAKLYHCLITALSHELLLFMSQFIHNSLSSIKWKTSGVAYLTDIDPARGVS